MESARVIWIEEEEEADDLTRLKGSLEFNREVELWIRD